MNLMQTTRILEIMRWTSWQVSKAHLRLSIDVWCCAVIVIIIIIIIIIIINSLCVSPLSESPATLESSLSPDELVPFQGCVIPPLTPQRFSPSEDCLVLRSSTEAANPPAQDGALWRGITQCQGRALGESMEVNSQVNPHCKIDDLAAVVHMMRQYLYVIYVMNDPM